MKPASVFPRSVDIHVHSYKGKEPAEPTFTMPSPPSPGRRSPPSPVSPIRPARADRGTSPARSTGGPPSPAVDMGVVAAHLEDLHDGSPDDSSDGLGNDNSRVNDSEEEVESEGDSLNDWDGRAPMLEVCLPRGEEEYAARLAFAYITPAEHVGCAAAFLRAALGSAVPHIPVELLPSSRGAMLLRFATIAHRELVRGMSPILHDGISLELERPEETDNRFFREREWLVYVAVKDYPPEHWNEPHIRNSFRGFCQLVEVDPACLTRQDYSPLRIVVAVHHRLDIPSELWVEGKDSALGGSIAQLMPIRVWRKCDQLGPDGNLVPFFRQLTQHALAHGSAGPSLPPPPAAAPPPTPAPLPATGFMLHLAALMAISGTWMPAVTAEAVKPTKETRETTVEPGVSAVGADIVHTASAAVTEDIATITAPRADTAPKRHSTRLAAAAAKEGGKYVAVADKAAQRTALKNSLITCSSALQAQVQKRNILSRTKLPIPVADLRKMVSAAGLGAEAANAVGTVTTPKE
ncbi:unnamed protein product [Urochloa decumbens]|uniref:Uncharacterized protein n=1 Tax=Urochloa decumbens TaxID=240449 RepID=A0ABC9DCP2_9POAL